MKVYQSKYSQLPGSSYEEVVAAARREFNTIRKITKRQPYVRSKYFGGDKIFLTVFWDHSIQKNLKERTKRLRLYKASLDLLRYSRIPAESVMDRAYGTEVLLHRFYGKTKEGVHFCVQVKQNVRTGRKDFMSVFDRRQK